MVSLFWLGVHQRLAAVEGSGKISPERQGYQFISGDCEVLTCIFIDFKELRGKCIHMDDRRSEPRLRVFKAGTIEFGGAGIDCTVRNITATGAALEVASPVGIPHEIILTVPTSQLRRHGYVVWRKEKRIGVVFD
jgi:hypothetical protein